MSFSTDIKNEITRYEYSLEEKISQSVVKKPSFKFNNIKIL